MVKVHEYATSQEAWEGINEYFFNEEEEINERGGGRNGPQMVSYDHYFHIRKAWVDPEFDFGDIFGYRKQKWSGLINNYIDRNILDIVKSQIMLKEKKRTASYNISLPFTNFHDNGKNCLLSLTFQKRVTHDHPIAIFNLRSSEVTKRLLVDFLLVQRIIEYIYGKDSFAGITMFCGNMYQNAESFTMYDLHKPLKKVIVKKKKSDYRDRVMKVLEHYKTCKLEDIKYKVHQRSVKQLQRPNGVPLSGTYEMKAKNLNI